MLRNLYGRWMYRWETALTPRDNNRIVRPVEWGFDWLSDFTQSRNDSRTAFPVTNEGAGEAEMLALNDYILRHRTEFFSYRVPQDFELETRSPQLFPTNVRPETLRKDAKLRRQAETGKLPQAQFLRFTSPVRTPYPENDRVNA